MRLEIDDIDGGGMKTMIGMSYLISGAHIIVDIDGDDASTNASDLLWLFFDWTRHCFNNIAKVRRWRGG